MAGWCSTMITISERCRDAGKTAFLKDCRSGNMIGNMIVNSKPTGWRKITKANSKELIFNGHSRLVLPAAKFVAYEQYETGGMFLKIYHENPDGTRGALKHMYAIRRRA